jgi:KUP system potassium uptake protein
LWPLNRKDDRISVARTGATELWEHGKTDSRRNPLGHERKRMTTIAALGANRGGIAQPGTPQKPAAALALAAIGIVFGDIGTSPLYTMATVFDPANGLPLTKGNLIGIVSLIVWSLILVVSLKYVTLIMRASNRGEGGIMALLALAASAVADRPRLRRGLLIAGVFGAALFYGDGVITPAISVLSAVEGLKIAAPNLKPYVVPITLVVLIALFLFQKRGTGGIGAVFGPIMLTWFAVLAVIGAVSITKAPSILAALNPLAALGFLISHGWLAFVSLGAVVLALTGAEALYADMGHFGASPIRLSWFGLVFPSLALTYLGQGALLIAEPSAVDNPFFKLFAPWALFPMVALATVATVIASQAVISGAYSMSKQAIQLGFLPRMEVVHTSAGEIGQVYVPAINWALLTAVVISVIAFGSSTALGAAYGIAVTGTMLITTVLTFFVLRYAWHFNWLVCLGATGFFFIIDVSFVGANLLKFEQGGWFPLLIGAVVFTLMSSWKRGWELVVRAARASAEATPLRQYLEGLLANPPVRVAGTAIFLTIDPDAVPRALLNNLEHNSVLHERVIFVHVKYSDVPYVPPDKRVLVEPIGKNCLRVIVDYGFKDEVCLPVALASSAIEGMQIDPQKVSYFLSRTTVVAGPGAGMWLWREKLFATMVANMSSLAGFLKLPALRVIELGSRIEI